MASQNMGLLNLPEIKSTANNSSFTSQAHVAGLWRSIFVQRRIYKMSGYNSMTGSRECWQSDDPTKGSPTVVPLVDVIIDAIMIAGTPDGD
jgi:hypothetical protein